MPTEPALPEHPGRGMTAAVLALSALLLSPILAYRMGLDQGVFAYIGAELLEGRWPYLGTWDHAFPGAMLLHALEILLLGRSIPLFRLFDLVYQMAAAYLIFRITCRVADRAGGFLAVVTYVLIYQSYGPWNTAQREGFAMPFVLLGLWLYMTRARRSETLTAAAIGLGLGVASLFKPTFLLFAVMYLPLAAERRWRRPRVVLAAAAALAAPAVVLTLVYWARGGLGDLYEATVAYQLQVYVHRTRGDEPLWLHLGARLGRLGGQTIALALASLPLLAAGPAARERRMLYLGYLAAVAGVLVQGTFAGYHYLPGLAVGAVLVGSLFTRLSRPLLGQRALGLGGRAVPARWLAAHLLAAAAAVVYLDPGRLRDLASLEFLGPPRPGELRIETVFDFTESYELAAYLRARTAPDEPIQVWGHESLVYYLADRDAASRFQTSNPLVMRVPGQPITPMQQRWRREFLRDVRARPPAYVAVVRDDHWWWAPERRSSRELLADFPAWEAFLRSRYSLEATVGRFLVYRRSDAAGRA